MSQKPLNFIAALAFCTAAFSAHAQGDEGTKQQIRRAVSQHTARCWHPPQSPGGGAPSVRLHVALDESGVIRTIELPKSEKKEFKNNEAYRQLASQIITALLACGTVRNLPADGFPLWQDMVLRFDP
jgi:hypothetical protein